MTVRALSKWLSLFALGLQNRIWLSHRLSSFLPKVSPPSEGNAAEKPNTHPLYLFQVALIIASFSPGSGLSAFCRGWLLSCFLALFLLILPGFHLLFHLSGVCNTILALLCILKYVRHCLRPSYPKDGHCSGLCV